MTDMENKRIIQREIKPKIEEIIDELSKVPDSKTIEEAEKLHRELSYLSTNDLLRQFTI